MTRGRCIAAASGFAAVVRALGWIAALASCSAGAPPAHDEPHRPTSSGPTAPAGSAGSGVGAPHDRHPTENAMHVELQISPAHPMRVSELAITVHIRNDGTAPVRLNTLLLPYPSLVLQVRDATAQRVPLGPPPVPPADDGQAGREELAPGKELTFDYHNPFGSTPPAGRYEVRFVHVARAQASGDWQGTLESAWEPFELGPNG